MNKQAVGLYNTRWLNLFESLGQNLQILDLGFLPFLCLPKVEIRLKEVNVDTIDPEFDMESNMSDHVALLVAEELEEPGASPAFLCRRFMTLASNCLAADQDLMGTLRVRSYAPLDNILAVLHFWYIDGPTRLITGQKYSPVDISINLSK